MTTSLRAGKRVKGYKGLGMEGLIARGYARDQSRNIEFFRTQAQRLASQLAQGASVLEVAPGPGYLAIELAKLGSFQVTGLDISHTFVALAAHNARQAGVAVAFHHGNAASMPFGADAFDLIVCMAAFKNFSEPVQALCEMHRVLRPGGSAIIFDLRPDASHADIRAHVESMRLGRLRSWFMMQVFKRMLLKRAHSKESFQQMVAQSPFKTCRIREDSLGMEVTLAK
jgi:ubiquinone/menaquinone biosynthesis C-methylase UbiE